MSSRYTVRYSAPNSLGGAYVVWADSPEHAHDKIVAMLAGARYVRTPPYTWAGPGRVTNGSEKGLKKFNPHATITSIEPT